MDFRRHIRIALLSTVLLAFALLCNQCLPLAGSGAVTPAMGCGATSTSSLTLEGSDGSNDAGLDSGPVDLPVTISKNLDGTDATSYTYTALGGSSTLRKSASALLAETETAIGVVKFNLKDHVCGTVLVIKDGKITEVLESDSGNDCVFSDFITAEDVGEPIAYTAFGPSTTATLQDDGTYETNGGDVSPIVIGIVKAPDALIEDYAVTVITTNLSDESDLQLTIEDDAKMAMATTSEDLDVLTFSATEADGTPVLASLEENGGEPEIALALDFAPDWLLSTPDEIVMITTGDVTNGTLFDSDLNIVNDIALDYAVPSEVGSLALQPGGNALAYAVPMLDPDRDAITMGIGLVEGLLDGEVNVTPPKLLLGNDEIFESMQLTWTGSFELAVVAQNDIGTSVLFTAPLAEAISEGLDTLPNIELLRDSNPLSQVQVATAAGTALTDLYFICGNIDLEDNYGICRATITGEGALASNITRPYAFQDTISRFVISPDRISYATVALNTEPPSLCFISFDTDETTCSAYGTNPVISPANPNVVGYIADLDDTNQVGIYNVDNNLVLQTEELSFAMTAQTVATNSSTAQVVEGGFPPYTYEIVDGQGIIDPDTGIFVANSLEGYARLRVTDSLGSSDEKNMHVKSPGSLHLDWSGGDAHIDFDLNRPTSHPGTFTKSMSVRNDYILEKNSDNQDIVYCLSDGGAITTDFGTNGATILDGSSVGLSDTDARSIIPISSRLLVAGDATYSRTGNPRKIFLSSLGISNGQPITQNSYNNSGFNILYPNTGSSEWLKDAIYEPLRDVVYMAGTTNLNGDRDLLLIKATSSGTVVTTYANNGKFVLQSTGNDVINKIAINSRSSWIYFIGVFSGSQVLGAISPDGQLGTNFGSGPQGLMTDLFPAGTENYTSLLYDNESSLLYVGGTQVNSSNITEWVVVAIDVENSQIVQTYSVTNTNAGVIPRINGMCLDFTHQRLLAVMQTSSPSTNSAWHLVRLKTSGGLDESFGDSGAFSLDPSTGFDAATSCATANSGSVDVYGTVNGNDTSMYRLVF